MTISLFINFLVAAIPHLCVERQLSENVKDRNQSLPLARDKPLSVRTRAQLERESTVEAVQRSLASFLVANICIFLSGLQLFSPDLLPLRFCQPMTAVAVIAATTTASTDIF